MNELLEAIVVAAARAAFAVVGGLIALAIASKYLVVLWAIATAVAVAIVIFVLLMIMDQECDEEDQAISASQLS